MTPETDRSPTTPARTCAGSFPPCSGRAVGDSLPVWMPRAGRHAEQVVLLVLDGLGWEQLEDRRALMPALTSLAGGADHHRGADDDGDRAELDRHRADPGRARPARVPDGARRRGAQRAALEPPAGTAGAPTRRATSSPSPPSSAMRCRWCRPAELQRVGVHRGPPARLAPGRLAGGLGDPRRGRAAARRGERFVYAYYGGIDKTAHERGFGDFYDAELRAADRLVADVLEPLPPRAVLLVTADHGQVDVGDSIVEPDPDLLAMVAAAVGRGPVPVVARASAARPTSCSPRQQPSLRRQAWVVTREQIIDERWFGPTVRRRWPPASATSPSSPTSR